MHESTPFHLARARWGQHLFFLQIRLLTTEEQQGSRYNGNLIIKHLMQIFDKLPNTQKSPVCLSRRRWYILSDTISDSVASAFAAATACDYRVRLCSWICHFSFPSLPVSRKHPEQAPMTWYICCCEIKCMCHWPRQAMAVAVPVVSLL